MTDTPPAPVVTFHDATPEMRDLMTALKATLVGRNSMPTMHVLAIASQFIGNLIALQDRAICTPEIAMIVVAKNIEVGNQMAVEAFNLLRAQEAFNAAEDHQDKSGA